LNSKRIRNARLALGLTQEQVQERCAELNVPVYNISRMESGGLEHPAPRVLPVLAQVLGLEISELLMPDEDTQDPGEDTRKAA
jgi:transcriptional regulator with XRE-family HTH domain